MANTRPHGEDTMMFGGGVFNGTSYALITSKFVSLRIKSLLKDDMIVIFIINKILSLY